MGLALEVIAGQATAIGAGPTNLPALAGSTLTVRNARLDSRVMLLQAWAFLQVAGFIQIRSPKLHDNVRGIRVAEPAAAAQPRLPDRFKQPLIPQDVLIFEGSAVDAAGDIESAFALVWYEDLAGTQSRLITTSDFQNRCVNLLTVYSDHVLGVAGGFSGEEAINADSDLLKANTDYAILGYLSDTARGGVFWRGIDTGNLRVGGPLLTGVQSEIVTRNWFYDLAENYDLPMIPVFNSANKGGFLVDFAGDENAGTVILQTIIAELTPAK